MNHKAARLQQSNRPQARNATHQIDRVCSYLGVSRVLDLDL
eukprot:CAMPEP_0198110490 /NCGR_PEP_ID=MMETSP1442-20131203/2513_1 /TAXON_ID= /ORGANISM="Craspedostauros australis, Strain CCMP3328" /LENGTH=40 /DNA_ID= /DNA_START= /DNA_END= /DNA_ORIENTATION=